MIIVVAMLIGWVARKLADAVIDACALVVSSTVDSWVCLKEKDVQFGWTPTTSS